MTLAAAAGARYRAGFLFIVALLSIQVGVAVTFSVAWAAEGTAKRATATQMAGQETAARAAPTTIGYIENVVVNPGNMHITAKIDTGARSSSIDAINILPFMKDGKEWVRFTILGEDDRRRGMELPVVRKVGIKRAGAPVSRRYVVEMSICLGPIHKKAQVNLVGRNDMKYRMLIGRLFTAGDFLVDPQSMFLTRPACQDR